MRSLTHCRVFACAVLLAGCGPGVAAAGQFEALRERIVRDHLRSVEEVLPLLPADLDSRYVLMFRSRSLQEASYLDPRAILYGRDARFVVSFNGDPGQRGYFALETMEFDDASAQFVFREISFPDLADPSAAVVFSAPNPPRCTECHGAPPGPVWDAGPLWPGAYGEHYHARLSAEENAGLRAFLRQQPEDLRYRVLRRTEALASREAFYPSARTRYEGGEVEPPNADLAKLLGRLNVRRVTAELTRHPRFPAWRYALLGAVSGGCGPIEGFFPAGLAGEARERYARFSQAAHLARGRQEIVKAQRASAARIDAPSGAEESLDRLRFLAEVGMGLSTAPWSLALERNASDFGALRSSVGVLAASLLETVAPGDAAVTDLSHYRTFTYDDRYCAHLRRESTAALEGVELAAAASAPPGHRAPGEVPGADAAAAVPAPPSAAPERLTQAAAIARPALLGHCAVCHASPAGPPVAPRIPFDDPARLATLLSAGGYPRGSLLEEIRYRLSPAAGAGRMPLDLNISEAERRGLESYFAALLTLYSAHRPAP